jgi:hypothetical protein
MRGRPGWLFAYRRFIVCCEKGDDTMKLLNWTRRFSRRGFLAGSVATVAAVATNGGSLLAGAQSPSDMPIDREGLRTLVAFARDLFPHDRLDDEDYRAAIAPLVGEAGKDSATRKLLLGCIAELNRLAIAASGKPYSDVTDEKIRVAVIKQIEGKPFFTKVYGDAIVGLYNNPTVWPKFGYEGPSSVKGGYINRGFNDLDWL